MTKPIYLDHAATTPLDSQVLEAMLPYLKENFGNPGSIYATGRKSKEAVENARSTVSQTLNCKYSEIIFTGSGTESDNLAILGTIRHMRKFLKKEPQDLHIITTTIEHDAVLQPFKNLEKEGYKVTYLKTDKYGLITPETLEQALTPETVFISIMYANNEVGTIEPIKELAKTAHAHENAYKQPVVFHTDACQAAGSLTLDIQELGIDLLTLNGSKAYGPKGVGVLYKATHVRLEPITFGGGQESGLRSGTENVANIVGIATALTLAEQNRTQESARLTTLRDKLIKGIENLIPRVLLNGHRTQRLPNNINMLILDIEGEALLLYLDDKGIEASTGSACHSKNLDPSHVLMAIGLPEDAVHGSIRFTLGKSTTDADIDKVLEILPAIVEKLREISPIKINDKILKSRK